MSRRIFWDIEEAISREVRRITTFEDRTLTKTVLQETFDPITGEIIQVPLEANYYDSSADTQNIQYPHFFVKLLKTREDRYSGREVSYYGADQGIGCEYPIETSLKAYERILYSSDGVIDAVGSTLKVSIFNIVKVQAGQLIRLLSGNNKGTYRISTVTRNSGSPHIITVSNDLLVSLSAISFNSSSRVVTFLEQEDLNTIKVGDVFRDSSSADFTISAVSLSTNSITIGGTTSPTISDGGKIYRSGNVFQAVDSTLVNYIVMDPTKPISGTYTSSQIVNPSIPLDIYYLVRIDSRERENHIDILNRVWEEFNPPRSGIPVIVRSATSAEQLLTVDVSSGGSTIVNVADNSDFNVNDPVCLFDNFIPTKSTEGGFQTLFEAKVVDKIGTTQLKLDVTVPDTFLVENDAKIVSNYTFQLLMLHFVDHLTKDVEGSQYWVHEFTFWIQAWVDRLGEPIDYEGVIQTIQTPLENLQGYVYTNS